MPYPDLKEPDSLEEYRRRISVNTEGVVSSIFGIIFVSLIGGAGLTIPILLLTSLSSGRQASEGMGFGGAFIIGVIIALVGSSFIFVPAMEANARIKSEYEQEARRAHAADWEAYHSAVKQREAAERRAREERERWEREAPMRERQAALKREEEERNRQRFKQAADLMLRREAWELAAGQAQAALDVTYNEVTIHLAAAEGVTDPEAVAKVFGALYPSLPMASDWRMGCLREFAPRDPRVRAILPHLPPPNAQNTRPT